MEGSCLTSAHAVFVLQHQMYTQGAVGRWGSSWVHPPPLRPCPLPPSPTPSLQWHLTHLRKITLALHNDNLQQGHLTNQPYNLIPGFDDDNFKGQNLCHHACQRQPAGGRHHVKRLSKSLLDQINNDGDVNSCDFKGGLGI